jgi:hypothetical protein
MADPRNIGGILGRGLLSTSQLLDVYRVTGDRREAIESQHRPDFVEIKSEGLPPCFIRDQRPMTMVGLAKAVKDVTPEEYLRFLNSHVFFWATEDRLSRMNGAPLYRDVSQLVLVIDTETLVDRHSTRIRLSPVNSGCTIPNPFARTLDVFKSIEEYDWENRRAARAKRIAELAIPGSVGDIWETVLRAEVWRGGEKVSELQRPYDDSLLSRLRPGKS